VPFLDVNGIRIPVADARPSLSFNKLGSSEFDTQGRRFQQERAHRRVWNIETKPITGLTANALRRFILGQMHVFNFDEGFHGSTGVNPLHGYSDAHLVAGDGNDFRL